MEDLIKITTYNGRGLRQQAKRRKVFAFLHRQNYHLAFIQETHSTSRDERFWSNEWGGRVVYSHGSSRSRGVCILFNPKLDFSIVHSSIDTHGRYILLDIKFSSHIFTLVGVYAPNTDSPLFFDLLTNELRDCACNNVIIGGDFNFVFSLNCDKKGGVAQTNFHARDHCLDLMACYDLVDVWRERNPH